MSKRPLVWSMLVTVVLLGGRVTNAVGDDDDDALWTRLFDVSALTQGVPDFLRPTLDYVHPDMVSDEESPLFGAEGEEPRLPVGTIDELVERIVQAVEPVSWEVTEGSFIRTQGDTWLVVRARRPVLDAIASYLVDLEREVLACYAIDVRALPLAPGEPLDPGLARAGHALEPQAARTWLARKGVALTLTAIVNQQAMGFVGRERAYVQDYDVEVAKGSRSSDPIVGVQMTGLAATARVSGGPERRRVRLRLDAVLSLEGPWLRHASGSGRLIELPHNDLVHAHTQMLLEPGRWHVAPGALEGGTPGAHVLLVRARPVPPLPARPGEATDVAWPAPDTGPLELRTFDVSDLDEAPRDRMGWDSDLVPSNFTPPEPPELAEPTPIFPQHALVDLLRLLASPRTWNRDGTLIEADKGHLIVRNTGPILEAVGSQIDRIRRVFLYDVILDVQAVRTTPALAAALLEASRDGAPGLGPRGVEALGAAVAAGDASILDALRVVSLSGARNTVLSGRQVPYVQDYEVEIADEVDVGNPVVQLAVSGTMVDLHPALTSTRDAVLVDVRMARTRLREPIRELESPFGPLQLPDLGVAKLKTSVVAPLGETTVLGLLQGGEEGPILLLLTPTLRAYDD